MRKLTEAGLGGSLVCLRWRQAPREIGVLAKQLSTKRSIHNFEVCVWGGVHACVCECAFVCDRRGGDR